MKRRYGLIALMATVGLVAASPAFGGPSAFDLALRAFKQSEEAAAKANRAGHKARTARRRATAARRKVRRLERKAGKVGRARRTLRLRVEALEAESALGSGANAISGRSAFSSDVCRNDETDPWEDDANKFLQCGDSVTLGVDREHRILVNVSVSWFGSFQGAIGECTVLDNGQPTGPVVSSGERTTTTSENATNGASFTSVLAPRDGESVIAVGCRERMSNIDWTDISISAVAIGAA